MWHWRSVKPRGKVNVSSLWNFANSANSLALPSRRILDREFNPITIAMLNPHAHSSSLRTTRDNREIQLICKTENTREINRYSIFMLMRDVVTLPRYWFNSNKIAQLEKRACCDQKEINIEISIITTAINWVRLESSHFSFLCISFVVKGKFLICWYVAFARFALGISLCVSAK